MKHKCSLPRKRIRGLRRHTRNHRARAALPESLQPELLAAHGARHQLGLAPWNVHGKPPVALRQLWASRLLADFYTWRQQLLASYPDFYLAIRLYEPRFGKSSLVAMSSELAARYRNQLGEPEERPLPPEYRALPGAAALRWTAYPEVDAWDTEEFAGFPTWYRRKPHWPGSTQDGQDYVFVQTGWLWVGEWPD